MTEGHRIPSIKRYKPRRPWPTANPVLWLAIGQYPLKSCYNGFSLCRVFLSDVGAEQSAHILHVDVKKFISIGHMRTIEFLYQLITPIRVPIWQGHSLYTLANARTIHRDYDMVRVQCWHGLCYCILCAMSQVCISLCVQPYPISVCLYIECDHNIGFDIYRL